MTFGQHPIRDPNYIQEVNAQQMAQCMEQLFSNLQAEMKRAQAIQSEQANKSQTARAELQVEECMLMDTQNLSTT